MVTGVKATAVGTTVNLTWDRISNITGYNVYISDEYSVNLEDYELVTSAITQSASVTSLGGKKLENFKTYYFVVTSTQGTWESNISNIAEATPEPIEVPSKVDSLVVSAGDALINFSYKQVSGAEWYNIYYKTEDEEIYTKGGTSETTSYTLYGLENDVTYDVYVSAENSIGEGPGSNVQTVTPKIFVAEDPGVPKVNMIDNSAIVSARLLNTNNVNTSFYPDGFNIENVYDGEYGTHWTANVWWYDGTVEFVLDEAYEMNYLVWVPRMDGNYSGSMGPHWQGNGSYNVTVWEEGDDLDGAGTQVVSGGLANKITNADGISYYILDFPKSNVVKIQVANGIYAGAPTVTSLSEIHFYNYDSLAEEVADLFADATYTSLKPNVTQSMIDALYARLDLDAYYSDYILIANELDLATSLLAGDTSVIGTVVDNVYKMSGFQPMGITGRSGYEVVIYADIPEGETVTITPTKFFAEVTAWQGSAITLTSGRNVITIPTITNDSYQGGPIYLNYNGTKADDISLHIKYYGDDAAFNTKQVQYMPVLDLYNWDNMTVAQRESEIRRYVVELQEYDANLSTISGTNLAENFLNATEVSMPYALLSLPANQIYSGISSGLSSVDAMVDRVYQNTETWIEFMELMFTIYGVDEANFSSQTRQNVRYMQMFSGAFMYAAGSHIGIPYGSVAELMRGVPTSDGGTGFYGWGISHEIGHNLDTIGYAEVTNNIYSQYAQSWDNNMQSGSSRVPFNEVFSKVSTERLGASNSVFVELGMYWQLRLAYEDSSYDQQSDYFYYNFNKLYRAGAYSGYTKDERIALIASEVAGKNLTDFFTSWGKELSAEVISLISKYPDEPRSIQYLNDESRVLRLQGATDLTSLSSVVATTEYFEDDTSGGYVRIALTGLSSTEISKLQGFKVLKNDEAVGFMSASDLSYDDIIGVANNLSYEYTLIPITKLGMELNEVDAGQIKISYDVVIDRDLWTAEIVGDDIVVTFSETVSSSGVRLQDYASFVTDNISIYTGSVQETFSFAPFMLEEFEEEIIEEEVLEEEIQDELDDEVIVTTSSSLELNFDVEDESDEDDLSEQEYIEEEEELEIEMSTFTLTELEVSTDRLIETLDFASNDTTDANKFIAYFNKPGTTSDDKRIWTYDLDQVVITGVTDKEAFIEALDFIQYPGDNIEFYSTMMGKMGHDYVFDKDAGDDGMIAKDTVVIIGTYRGDPVYNTIYMKGIFQEVDHINGTYTEIERYINGDSILFAEVPDDGEVSETSDGFFIFIPNVQAESELAGHDHEDGEVCENHYDSVFPVSIQAELKRSDDPYYTSATDRTTSTTNWEMTPSFDTLPSIILE